MADKIIGVYICTDCGIGKALNIAALEKVATSELKAEVVISAPFLCSQEGTDLIRNDINNEGVNTIIVAACSPRVNYDAFDFDPLQYVTERVNLREQIVWTQTGSGKVEAVAEEKPEETTAPAAEGIAEEASGEETSEAADASAEVPAAAAEDENTINENTQEMAEDHLRMGITRAKKSLPPEPHIEAIDRTILVIGGGKTGLTSALESAKAGYNVVLVETEAELGGMTRKMYKILPDKAPFEAPQASEVMDELISAAQNSDKIKIITSAGIESIEGQPGQYQATVKHNGGSEQLTIGSVILAIGWKPYDASKLGHLGYGKFKNVITNVEMEQLASDSNGQITRPSDGKQAKRVAFLQCAGQRDPEHLPYCSSVCCLTSLKQAMYVTDSDQAASAFIIYKDMRTPGLYENFYKTSQNNPGVMLTKGEVTSITEDGSGNIILEVDNTILGEKVQIEADMLVLATGMVTNMLPEGVENVTDLTPDYVGTWKETKTQDGIIKEVIADPVVLNLKYRQGPELPHLKYGFPDSHFICFPYETRRTGIYAAGAVRHPMTAMQAGVDGTGAALKAIQCMELTSQGKAVHPRAGDQTFPEFDLATCTQCRRCTVECPFGVLDEDEKGTPKANPFRCRRCGTCMGACPQRIISFKNYSVDMVASMMKSIKVPEVDEKPRIIALICENDAMPAIDMAGINRLNISPFYRFIPLRCLGGVNLVWIADSLSAGVEGVLLIGCKYGDDYQCHFVKGSQMASERLGKVQETLSRLMLEAERVEQVQLAINEWDQLPGILNDFADRLKTFGPNPFKGF